ncbi:hypothetical protein BN1221_03356 [Brenneria goodwinii]|uniref:Uncharacterized protein n=1 Tax=Brenneria goodwinii TaxID=1109412 RepID=A0A0G4JY94_9GAMM|nr:hypothetical protein BN1221_03356 [Brenneria goodwinii]
MGTYRSCASVDLFGGFSAGHFYALPHEGLTQHRAWLNGLSQAVR